RALTRGRAGAREVVALEVPALLRRRRGRLEVLQELALGRIDRVEMRVRPWHDAAVEPAHERDAARAERGARHHPAGSRRSAEDCRLLGRSGGDEEVVEDGVVELD